MLDFSPQTDGSVSAEDIGIDEVMVGIITGSLWEEPRDFPAIVTAIQRAGYATPGFPARMFLALEQLLQTNWVSKRRGLFCLTPLGRMHVTRDKAPRFHAADLN